jgi:hypothetical protein
MKSALASLLILLATSCSFQGEIDPSGYKRVNVNLFSAGTLHAPKGGGLLMSGTSEEAAKQLRGVARDAAVKSFAGDALDTVESMTK